MTDPGTGGTSGSAGAGRPRPEYGEYATPEQQAAAAGIPYRPHVHAAPPHGQQPAAIPPPPPAGYSRVGAPVSTSTSPAAAPGRRWDFVLSTLLLGYGLFNVVIGSSQYTDLAGLINTQFYGPQKIGTFTATPLAAQLGVVIIVSQIVLYVITAALTVASLRAGRLSFWIPVAGGLLAGIVVFICFAALVFPDPAYQSWANHLGG